MLNMNFLRPANLLAIGIIAVFARTLLDGFVKIVDNGGEEAAKEG